MANSLTNSPGIVTLAEKTLIDSRNAINDLKIWLNSFEPTAAEVYDTIKIPIYSGKAEEWDETSSNFGTKTSDVDFIPMTISSMCHSTYAFAGHTDLMEYTPDMQRMSESNAWAIRDYIDTKFSDLIVSANISATYELTGDLTKKKVAQLRAQCPTGIRPSDCNLVVDELLFSEILSLYGDVAVFGGPELVREGRIPNLLGFRNVTVGYFKESSGTRGIIAPYDAIAVGSRPLKLADPESYREVYTATDPETGFSFTSLVLGNGEKNKVTYSTASVWGFKLLKPTQCKLIV